ncbi:MAG: nuclear transport factor 2 family protein [Lachnospiraceae bacterium]|nr:nuclear transport factor 2 family protein [Lachnospiraceae bacterium]
MAKKNKNSLIKTITLAVFFVSIILIYFHYIANVNKNVKREPNKDELEQLVHYDMINDYPKSARDVVKLHCRYSKLIYANELTDDELTMLCNCMRQLYAKELLQYNPANTAVQALKNDIKRMEEEEYKYKSYTLPEASQIQYYNQYGVDMATMEVTITMGTKDEVGYYYQQYVLVEEDGKWKILAWGESKMGQK